MGYAYMITSLTMNVHKKNTSTSQSPDHSITFTIRRQTGVTRRKFCRTMAILIQMNESTVGFDNPKAFSMHQF